MSTLMHLKILHIFVALLHLEWNKLLIMIAKEIQGINWRLH